MNSLSLTVDWTEAVSPLLVDAAWKSVLLLAVTGLAFPLMRRCSAAVRHLVLFGALCGLLALPFLSRSLPRLEVLPAWLNIGSASLVATTSEAPTAGDRAAALPASGPSSIEYASLARDVVPAARDAGREGEPKAAVPPAATGVRPWVWVTIIWLLGVSVILLRAMGGLVRLARLQRRAQVDTSKPLHRLLEQVGGRTGTAGRIQLLMTAGRAMPMTWGVLRPKILLPREAADWPTQRLQSVLRHEVAHIERWDFVTTLVVRIVCALYWFNPLVWLVARQIRLEQEQACDDRVLCSGAAADGYAEDILRVATGTAALPHDATGALTMARVSTLEERLRAILDRDRARSSLSAKGSVAILATAFAAIVPLAMLRAAERPRTATPLLAAAAVAEPAAQGTGAATSSGTATRETSGLIAWWRAEGDATDSAGQHHGEHPYGMSYIKGASGRAFDFRRRTYEISNQLRRISIPDRPEFQVSETFTLEARILIGSFGGIIFLRGDDRAGYDTWQLDVITPGKISFNFDDAENRSEDLRTAIETNTWYHVVAVFDRGTMKLFLNGKLAAQATTALRPNRVLDPQRGAWLGIGNTGGNVLNIPFDGLIDEVKLYNRALSEADVVEASRG